MRAFRIVSALVVVLSGALIAVATPAASEEDSDLACAIGTMSASISPTVSQSGAVVFTAQALMSTSGCGTGPKVISAAFVPVVSGTPATCAAIPSVLTDNAACTTGLGAAVNGTSYIVVAAGAAAGTSAVFPDAEAGTCTLSVSSSSTTNCSM